MTHIVRLDRDLLDVWAEHGIPKNVSTQEKRDELVLRLWALVQEQEARIAELIPFVIQKCDKCGLVTAPYDASGTKDRHRYPCGNRACEACAERGADEFDIGGS